MRGVDSGRVYISKLLLVDCTCPAEENIIKEGQQRYGTNFWMNTIDITQQRDFDRYMSKMRREGFDVDFIMSEDKENSMSNCIAKKNRMMFNVSYILIII